MNRAFSLVELSIVLVILGLLTGGILAGQSLIKAAELRSVTSEFQRYTAAVYAFRDKYMAYPGDMPTATRFWGARDGGDGQGIDCFSIESTATTTCNGNGDGQMNTAVGVAAPYDSGERYHVWVHLANAGLVEGNYTGRTDSTTIEHARTPGKNVPRSKLSNNGWIVAYVPYIATNGDANWFQGSGGSNLIALSEQGQHYSSLNPEQLWNIDTKLDDSRPATGRITTGKSTSTFSLGACSTSDVTSAEYAVQNTASKCWAVMRIE